MSARTSRNELPTPLLRAARFLRLPTSPDQAPEPVRGGLRCPVTGRVYRWRHGVLDLLPGPVTKTITQRSLDSGPAAWAYDRFRNWLAPALGIPAFAGEVAMIQRTLRVQRGDVLLDLACGPGNFTIEWARRAGPTGLVIGLDLSTAMLERAAANIQAAGLDNVLLIHGDALRLPFADGSLAKVNCSGGFHQFPELEPALGQIARVSANEALLTASTFAAGPGDRLAGIKRWARSAFALHFVPLADLGGQLAALGYRDYRWSLPGGWFGYASARKGARVA